MKVAELHTWNLDPDSAARLQERFAHKVRFLRVDKPFLTVCGTDVHVEGGVARSACVALGLPGLQLRDRAVHRMPVKFPYIPGLLSFREIPPLLPALKKLSVIPDVILVDGHGLAHPRRFGLACHLGVLTGTPCVGCAKSKLVGRHEELASERGSRELLYDENRVIGAVVRTRTKVRPVFVSVGHLIDLERCIDLVLECTPRFRIPEPLRLAHQLASSGTIG